MNYSCIKTADHITVVVAETGDSGTVNVDDKGYDQALQAVREGRYDDFLLIANPATVVHKYGDDRIVIEDGVVTFDGEVLHGVLADRMVGAIQDGFGIEPLAAFLINLNENPSKRAVDELYGFLEVNNLPLTEDGHFTAYKKVRDDYMDCYTQTIDNSVGEVVKMTRNKVDEDKNRTCSQGLHFCGRSYLNSYPGERTMILKINPADVVAIPADYNGAKGRCCKYEVVGELSNGRTENGERLEEELEGSVYVEPDTPYTRAARFDPDTAEVYDFYNTEASARNANSHQRMIGGPELKFWDFGYGSTPGRRYALLYV